MGVKLGFPGYFTAVIYHHLSTSVAVAGTYQICWVLGCGHALYFIVISIHEKTTPSHSQGTIGLELIDQVPDLDAVLVAVSGGGLSSGIATAVKSLRPSCRIYLVTPQGKPVVHPFLF